MGYLLGLEQGCIVWLFTTLEHMFQYNCPTLKSQYLGPMYTFPSADG